MSVESFDPKSAGKSISTTVVERLLRAASEIDETSFGLAPREITELAAVARVGPTVDWKAAVDKLPDDDAVALVRLYTLAEGQFESWKAGAKSPVIAIVAVLRKRGGYSKDLTAWIKAHTENKFLPYGSLLDRL